MFGFGGISEAFVGFLLCFICFFFACFGWVLGCLKKIETCGEVLGGFCKDFVMFVRCFFFFFFREKTVVAFGWVLCFFFFFWCF